MPYSAQTFTNGEVPTVAKFNLLWSNDASFNDGSGIADNAIVARHIETEIKKGWFPVSATITYISASSFKIAGDWRNIIRKGTKLKFTNTTGKFGYAVSDGSYASGETTYTYTGGTGYPLANAAITGFYYSNDASPGGHPIFLNYTPTFPLPGAMSYTSVSLRKCQFSIQGNRVFVDLHVEGTTGGTAANAIYITLPDNVVPVGGDGTSFGGGARLNDGGSPIGGAYYLDTTGTPVAIVTRFDAATNFGLGTGRSVRFNLAYHI